MGRIKGKKAICGNIEKDILSNVAYAPFVI